MLLEHFPKQPIKVLEDANLSQDRKYSYPNRIALINMPFYSTRWASIQLGLLKSVLVQNNIAAEDFYLNMPFAKGIGWVQYDNIALVTSAQIGEWLFGYAAYNTHDKKQDEEYLNKYQHNFASLLKSLPKKKDDSNMRILFFNFLSQSDRRYNLLKSA